MAHIVKCKICGERFDRDIEPYVRCGAKRYAHAHCALDKWEEGQEKPIIIDPNNYKICTYCKETINLIEDNWVQINNNLYAHKDCKDKEDARPKSDREQLENYICKLYNVDFCSPYILKQINTFEKERGYTCSGMLKCLVYFYDIKNNSLPERQTIGIIPYIWDEAREYYKKIYYSNLYNQKRDMHNYIPKTKEVTISTPYRKILKKRNLFTFLDEEGEKDKQ